MHVETRSSCFHWRALGAVSAAGLAAFVTLGCGGEETVVIEEKVPLSVKTLVIGGGGASSASREFTGSLAAWQHAEMAFEVAGKITEFNATEGQRVDEGFVLARLDPRDFQAGLAAAEANIAQAKADYLRYKTLFEKGVAAEAEYEARKRRYEVTQAERISANKAVEDAALVAPFDGVMARKLVEDFQNVQAKQPILILQDDTRFKINVTVPEQDMAGGRPENVDLDAITRALQPVVTVTSLPSSRFPAELYELSTTADPVTRTFDATFVMDAPVDQRVLPGMTANVKIRRVRLDQLGSFVPGVAVWADEAGSSYVWKLDPATNQVHKIAVEVGELTGSDIQIVGGLGNGDTIVTSGVRQLEEGDTVRSLGERLR